MAALRLTAGPLLARRLLATFAALSLAVAGMGCADGPPRRSDARSGVDPALFAARDAKLHPVFTKLADWDANGSVEGVDALVELHDQFGDPTKGAGTFLFELFSFRAGQPDPRGPRLYNPWVVEVVTPQQQQARWSRTSRCYSFRLAADGISRAGSYVLTATFAPADGGPRSFDRVVLAGATSNGAPNSAPNSTAPSQAIPEPTGQSRNDPVPGPTNDATPEGANVDDAPLQLTQPPVTPAQP